MIIYLRLTLLKCLYYYHHVGSFKKKVYLTLKVLNLQILAAAPWGNRSSQAPQAQEHRPVPWLHQRERLHQDFHGAGAWRWDLETSVTVTVFAPTLTEDSLCWRERLRDKVSLYLWSLPETSRKPRWRPPQCAEPLNGGNSCPQAACRPCSGQSGDPWRTTSPPSASTRGRSWRGLNTCTTTRSRTETSRWSASHFAFLQRQRLKND